MKDRDFIKFQEKNHRIWILYDEEILITNCNCRLKRKRMVREAGRHTTWSNINIHMWICEEEVNLLGVATCQDLNERTYKKNTEM
jgi:hypothetical protein